MGSLLLCHCIIAPAIIIFFNRLNRAEVIGKVVGRWYGTGAGMQLLHETKIMRTGGVARVSNIGWSASLEFDVDPLR